MIAVMHSKCSKCDKVQHIEQLKDNPEGAGLICNDEMECKSRLARTDKADVTKDPK